MSDDLKGLYKLGGAAFILIIGAYSDAIGPALSF